MGLAVAGFIGVAILVAIALSTALVIFPTWRICRRAGFPGVLSLLMLVPLGNIFLLFYLAFAKWPAMDGDTGRP